MNIFSHQFNSFKVITTVIGLLLCVRTAQSIEFFFLLISRSPPTNMKKKYYIYKKQTDIHDIHIIHKCDI
jgi:hypothetical protein